MNRPPPTSTLFPYTTLFRSTPHFDYVASEATRGIGRVATSEEIPVGFGILTVETIEQAIERAGTKAGNKGADRSEEHTSELQSQSNLVCRLLLEKKKRDKQS